MTEDRAVRVIATGSDGNAVLVGGEILVDAGVPFRALSPWVKGMKLVLLTHSHGDHFKRSTVRRLAKERPGLRFACPPWLVPALLLEGVKPRQIDTAEDGAWLRYAGLASVRMRPTLHDVPNCCWFIHREDGTRFFYATDTGSLEGIEAKGYDWYLIEANRPGEELRRDMEEKMARGEFSYERRVIGTHLMEEQARAFLADNMGENSRYIFLHQHRET